MCCPMGRPNTEVGVGSANLNLATLWLSCVFFTSLKSLKFSGSMLPTEKKKKRFTNDPYRNHWKLKLNQEPKVEWKLKIKDYL